MSGVVVWFTGLPASGKSTLAARVKAALGREATLLDSDLVRSTIGATSYTTEDRDAFYAALAATAGGFAWQDKIVLVAATASKRGYRDAARAAAPAFLEVFVRTSLADCEARDRKGNYTRARAGEAPTLPGIGTPYEPPMCPDVIAEGGHDDAAVHRIVDAVDAITHRSRST